jgi:hypothetical protein
MAVGAYRYRNARLSKKIQSPVEYLSRRLALDSRQEKRLAEVLAPKRLQTEQVLTEFEPKFEERMDHFHSEFKTALTAEQTAAFDSFWARVRQKRKESLPLRILMENCGAGFALAPTAAAKTDAMAPRPETAEDENDEEHKLMHSRILDELQAKLHLTPAQLDTAEELLEQSHRETLPLRRELRRRITPITMELDTEVAALLNPVQIGVWKAIRLEFVDTEDCPINTAPGER